MSRNLVPARRTLSRAAVAFVIVATPVALAGPALASPGVPLTPAPAVTAPAAPSADPVYRGWHHPGGYGWPHPGGFGHHGWRGNHWRGGMYSPYPYGGMFSPYGYGFGGMSTGSAL